MRVNVESFHRRHRNTVGQTITFVQTLFVKIECFEKNFGRVQNVFDFVIFDNCPNGINRRLSCECAVFGKIIEDFDYNGFGYYDDDFAK